MNPEEPEIHLFPELFLTGYPLQDLCLDGSFQEKYQDLLARINTLSSEFPVNDKILFLMGGLDYQNDLIHNSILSLSPGKELVSIYDKMLLPSYDIFDEKKYFQEGSKIGTIHFHDFHFALLICEDMWFSPQFHERNPVQELFELHQEKERFDAILNLSASPYTIPKISERMGLAKSISKLFECPLAYLNRVGGEDEILFDGNSFVQNKDNTLAHAQAFKEDKLVVSLEKNNKPQSNTHYAIPQIFQTASFFKFTDEEMDMTIKALSFGLQEYARKSGFNKFVIALSGGLDSSVVLSLVKLSLSKEQSVEAIFMPTSFSSTLSRELSEKLCHNLGIKLYHFPISFLHKTIGSNFSQIFNAPLNGLADENLQSRLRGLLLYTRSNQTSSLVINTSNKSELSVGYSTLYGDSVGAISLLGDLYKTEVFQIAKYINKKYHNLLPEEIISRPPSAELRENQKDEDSLPPYSLLDPILDEILAQRSSLKHIVAKGYEPKMVEKIFSLYKNSEFKRQQFCPILKIKPRSFGFGYRVPISKNNNFYF